MNLSLIHWHIELSSICTLKCPRCPRAEVPETLLNRQLTLDFFKNQIGIDVVQQIKRITFCGNDGDPIYCREFLDICKWIKEVNPDICLVIVTNGSHKKAQWWEDLATILNNRDEIHFSVDGWDQASNEQYRVNSDYDSILNGITTFREHNSDTYFVWAAIAFKFNEDKIDTLKQNALQLGFDCFQLTLSTKFGIKYPNVYGDIVPVGMHFENKDSLQPSAKYIPNGHRFERVETLLSDKKRFSNEIKRLYKDIIEDLDDPKLCLVGSKGVFLNSHGEFYPCCWVATRYEANNKWIELGKTNFNLYNKTFNEVMDDEFWQNDFLKFDSLECKNKCTNNSIKGDDFLLNW